MSENPDSPTPEQLEAMKQATAFAYGYTQVLLEATGLEKYKLQLIRLEHDLRYFDCVKPETRSLLKEAYLPYEEKGTLKAREELEKLGL